MAYFLHPKDCIPDKILTINGVTVKEYLVTKHNPNNIDLPPKMVKSVIGVTIHNTNDLANIEDDGRNYTAATVNGNMNTVRIHYYVDDLCAWQNLPLDYQSWHAGWQGKKDANGSEKGNTQTISIECIMDGITGTANEKAEDNTARLAAYLLKKYNLTIDNLYTHNYWCNVRIGRKGTVDYLNTINDGYKGCPIFIRPHWNRFKDKVNDYLKALGGQSSNTVTSTPAPVTTSTPTTTTNTSNTALPYCVKVIDTSLNVRKGAGLNYAIVTTIKKGEVYTIVEEKVVVNSNGTKATWGKLASGVGWINVGSNYVSKINVTPTTSTTQSKPIVSPYKGKFRVSQEYKGTAHQGLDLVGVESKNIYATVDGIVEIAGNNDPNGFGIYVRILAANGWRYYYGHLSQTKVKIGAKVRCGDLIGVEGSTGKSTGNHCHYEVRKTSAKSSFADINEISGIPNKIGTYEDNSKKG